MKKQSKSSVKTSANPYETAARGRKVDAFVTAIDSAFGADALLHSQRFAGYLMAQGEDWWAKFAQAIGQHIPSHETRAVIVSRFVARGANVVEVAA